MPFPSFAYFEEDLFDQSTNFLFDIASGEPIDRIQEYLVQGIAPCFRQCASLAICAEYGRFDVLKYLLSHHDMVELLSSQTEPEHVRKYIQPALSLATNTGRLDIVQVCLYLLHSHASRWLLAVGFAQIFEHLFIQ